MTLLPSRSSPVDDGGLGFDPAPSAAPFVATLGRWLM
jgi:hypothetical protein